MNKAAKEMGRNYMERKTCLELCFGGKDEIELSTLTQSLEKTLHCLTQIANANNGDTEYCKFIVKTIKPGSFKVLIEELINNPALLLGIVDSVVSIFVSITEIRKHLKGAEPLSIKQQNNQYNVTNINGEILTVNKNVYNIYTNDNDIEHDLANISKVVANDRARTYVEIKATDGETQQEVKSIRFEHSDLVDTSNALDVEKYSKELFEEIGELKLKIKRPCFVGDTKWDFIILMNSQNISASIEDTEWLKNVQDGKVNLCAGTTIRASIRFRYQLDKNGNKDGKTKYAILKVLEVSEPKSLGEQMTFL